jgi:acyl-CoA oxidase
LFSEREALLVEIQPNALVLMEAFGYNDNTLKSAIGSSNGRPYENLINWAKEYNSLNKKHERDQIVEAIKKAKQ